MNLFSLLHRRHHVVPPLSLIAPDDRRPEPAVTPPPAPQSSPGGERTLRQTPPLTDEERLERLPNPGELDVVLEERIDRIDPDTDPGSAPPRPRDAAAP